MPDITIRRVSGAELIDSLLPLTHYAFASSPPFAKEEDWQERAARATLDTMLVLYEDARAMAVASSAPMSHNARGVLFPMGGVWGVATHPAGRRNGYARQTLRRLFETMREEGMVFTGLYPFRVSFYERLGYIAFPYVKSITVAPRDLLPVLKWELGGQVERVAADDGFDAYQDLLRACQTVTHGMSLFDDEDGNRRRRREYWLALARVAGEVVGGMLYTISGFAGKLFAPRFSYTTLQGRYLLLDWIARHTDQISEAEIHLPAYEQPELWLSDLYPRVGLPSHHYNAMARVLDVARMEGLRTGSSRFVARIRDEHCPWNAGVFAFESEDGALRVRASRDAADCNLTIHGLSALVYGTHDPASFALFGWGDPAPEVQSVLRAVFPLQMPYMHETY